jgi:hypothetical protein
MFDCNNIGFPHKEDVFYKQACWERKLCDFCHAGFPVIQLGCNLRRLNNFAGFVQ